MVLYLQHALDQFVDLFSSCTSLSTFHKVQKLGLARESSLGVGELERPQEVVCFLEVRSDSGNFVDEVGCAVDVELAKTLFHNTVLSNGDTLLADLSETTLVNELLDSSASGVSVGDIRLDQSQHADGGLVELDKGSIVKLSQTEQLHNLLGLGGDSDGTANTDDKTKLGLGRDVESSVDLGLAAVVDGLLFCLLEFRIVLLGSLSELLHISYTLGFGFLGSLGGGLSELGLSGLLLQNGLRGLHGG
jgi:hypothetical protein